MTAAILLALLANTWTVDASGAGDFTDLQVAIDTVAAGDTLLIRGAVWGYDATPGQERPVTVTKSLTIRGIGSKAFIGGAGWAQDSDATGLVIDAGADAKVTIEHLTIRGGDHESYGMNGADGIRVLSVDALLVERCDIKGGDMWINGPWYGDSHGDTQEGIEVRGLADRVVIRDSKVEGGKGCYADGYGPNGNTIYPSVGSAGITLAGAAHAIVERCDAIGGDGGDCVVYIPWTWQDRRWGPPTTHGADGGAGIILGPDVAVLGGTQVGGVRGRYLFDPLDPSTWFAWFGFVEGKDAPAIEGDAKRGQ